jgi:hypothetical protein
VELPPAANAITLFEWVIGAPPVDEDRHNRWPFASGLHALCEDLVDLEEELHSKRFVSNTVSRPESDPPFEILRREDLSKEGWVSLCEQYGQSDAGAGHVTTPPAWSPPRALWH